MIISVRVVPRSSSNLIEKAGEVYRVRLTKPAQDGLANKQLIELLSEYLGIKKYRLKIIKGHNCRDKLIEISS